MSIGKLNTPIKIIKIINEKDSDGFSIKSKHQIAHMQAYFEIKNTTEKWSNRTILKDASALFIIRRNRTLQIDRTMFIECQGEQYQIVSIENVRNKNMYFEIVGKLVQ